MVLKIINATEARVGTNLILEGEFYTLKKMDISKTGKHGHAKCRVEAVGLIRGEKKVVALPGHDKVDSPVIEKRSAQVLSVHDGNANVMDEVNFETFDLKIPEELEEKIEAGIKVLYWVVLDEKVLMEIK